MSFNNKSLKIYLHLLGKNRSGKRIVYSNRDFHLRYPHQKRNTKKILFPCLISISLYLIDDADFHEIIYNNDAVKV